MIDATTKEELAGTIYFPLRVSRLTRGMSDLQVRIFARKVVDHMEISGWLVAKRSPDP